MCQNTHVYESSLYMYLLLVHWNVSREKGPNYTCSFNKMPPNDVHVCLIMYLGVIIKCSINKHQYKHPCLFLTSELFTHFNLPLYAGSENDGHCRMDDMKYLRILLGFKFRKL